MVRLTFHGAAETVTGSKYLLGADGKQILIDCGLFQGLKKLRLKNWEPPPFEPEQIDSVVLTHAHIDHTGYLPRLVRHGLRAPVYCTPATKALTELLLMDAAKIQESDANYANRRGFSKHKPALPLFDTSDARRAIKRLRTVRRGEWFTPAEPIWIRYHNSGHLLGSAMVEVEIRGRSSPLRILFSGDVGRYRAPLYHDPSPPPACDNLICESTYGDRNHATSNLLDQLCDVMQTAIRRGGVILVASFAVGRAQQLLYLLELLMNQGRIPQLPIHLDSPMAINATGIYCDHADDHDLSEGELAGSSCVLNGPNIHPTRSVEESKRLNALNEPAVIISSSGMMTGGRILHHLRRRLPDEKNTIVLGGYMAAGTRGRKLQDGAATLRMHGRDVPVKAAVTGISGLSAHAGRDELLRWLKPLGVPRRAFITHGEKTSATRLANTLRQQRGWETVVPRLGDSFELENLS